MQRKPDAALFVSGMADESPDILSYHQVFYAPLQEEMSHAEATVEEMAEKLAAHDAKERHELVAEHMKQRHSPGNAVWWKVFAEKQKLIRDKLHEQQQIAHTRARQV